MIWYVSVLSSKCQNLTKASQWNIRWRQRNCVFSTVWCPAESRMFWSAVLIYSHLSWQKEKKNKWRWAYVCVTAAFVNMPSCCMCFPLHFSAVIFRRYSRSPPAGLVPLMQNSRNRKLGTITHCLHVRFNQSCFLAHLDLLLMPTSFWTKATSMMKCFLLRCTWQGQDDVSLCWGHLKLSGGANNVTAPFWLWQMELSGNFTNYDTDVCAGLSGRGVSVLQPPWMVTELELSPCVRLSDRGHVLILKTDGL